MKTMAKGGWVLAFVAVGSLAMGCMSAPAHTSDDSDLTATKAKKKKAAGNDYDSSDYDDTAVTAPKTTPALSLRRVEPQTITNNMSTTLTLTGTSFQSSARVMIGGTVLPATVTSSTTLTVIVAPNQVTSSGMVNVHVISGSPEATSNDLSVTVGGQPNVLVNVTPNSIPQNTRGIFGTVQGNGFDLSSSVVLNGLDLQTTFLDSNTLRFAIPDSILEVRGQYSVAVRRAGALSTPLPFVVTAGTSGSTGMCDLLCEDFGLANNECVELAGGLFQSSSLMHCELDGCMRDGC